MQWCKIAAGSIYITNRVTVNNTQMSCQFKLLNMFLIIVQQFQDHYITIQSVRPGVQNISESEMMILVKMPDNSNGSIK